MVNLLHTFPFLMLFKTGTQIVRGLGICSEQLQMTVIQMANHGIIGPGHINSHNRRLDTLALAQREKCLSRFRLSKKYVSDGLSC